MSTDYQDAVELTVGDRQYKVAFCTGLLARLNNNIYTQCVTTCVIRTNNPLRFYYGVTIESPADSYDSAIGRRYAFKRAVQALWKDMSQIAITYGKASFVLQCDQPFASFYSAMRKALREAYNPTPDAQPAPAKEVANG